MITLLIFIIVLLFEMLALAAFLPRELFKGACVSGFHLKFSGTFTCPAGLYGTEVYNTCHCLVETTFAIFSASD